MYIKLYVFVIFLVGLLSCSVLQATNSTTYDVVGTGVTLKVAIEDALVAGIQQAKGVKIDSEEFSKTVSQEIASYDNDKSESKGSISGFRSGSIKLKSAGIVQNYEILSKEINDAGLHEVTIRVNIATYKGPGPATNRRKIAVMPFSTTKDKFVFWGENISADEVSRQINQFIVSEITQFRKFTVLDREYTKEFLSEKNLIMSSDVPIAEQVKIGEVLGVDYLLVGNISKASMVKKENVIRMSGEKYDSYQAAFAVDYRIIVMATRNIKWSDSVTVSLGGNELYKKASSSDPDEIKHFVLSDLSKKVAHKALENIYPARVVGVQGNGEIILNQGGITVSVGSVFDVFALGEKIIDSYTGESLGAAESWVATLEIERVTAKMSYGKVIKGSFSDIKKGSISRRKPNSEKVPEITKKKAKKEEDDDW